MILSVKVCVADNTSVSTERTYTRQIISRAPLVYIHMLIALLQILSYVYLFQVLFYFYLIELLAVAAIVAVCD